MSVISEATLDRYADLVLRVGLGLQAGQPLLVRTNIAGAPFARRVADVAYRSGSGLVSVLYTDSEVGRSRLRHARDEALTTYPAWQAYALNETIPSGTAVLSIIADDPDAYADEDPHRIAQTLKAAREELQPFYDGLGRDATNWCIVAMPVPEWASKVFPDEPIESAEGKLWDAVLASVRLDRDDPLAAWQEHIDALEARARHLNERAYRELHYRGPGTDLRIGLARDHVWAGPQSESASGARFVANLPTEEVFTAPHREHAEGTVRATRPLSHGGKVIDGFWLRFADGRVVEAGADVGEDTLHEILDVDEGARRLGEVALVEASSPIAQTGLLFYDTLFDENASCHFALGRAYRFNIRNGSNMTAEEAEAHGANPSLTHVDFMVGSGDLDVDGVRQDGTTEPVMRAGSFAF